MSGSWTLVRLAGSALEVWFALGRYEGGEGLFGHVDWSQGSAELSMDPVMTCVPWSGQPVWLSDSDTAVADMNGDGLPDLVRVRENDIKYWLGRGDGTYIRNRRAWLGGSAGENQQVLPHRLHGLDGKVRALTKHHALSVDRWDAEVIGPGPHQGTYASEHRDGFGRVVRTTVRVRESGVLDLHHLDRTYLPTGEVTSLTRWHGDESATGRRGGCSHANDEVRFARKDDREPEWTECSLLHGVNGGLRSRRRSELRTQHERWSARVALRL